MNKGWVRLLYRHLEWDSFIDVSLIHLGRILLKQIQNSEFLWFLYFRHFNFWLYRLEHFFVCWDHPVLFRKTNGVSDRSFYLLLLVFYAFFVLRWLKTTLLKIMIHWFEFWRQSLVSEFEIRLKRSLEVARRQFLWLDWAFVIKINWVRGSYGDFTLLCYLAFHWA